MAELMLQFERSPEIGPAHVFALYLLTGKKDSGYVDVESWNEDISRELDDDFVRDYGIDPQSFIAWMRIRLVPSTAGSLPLLPSLFVEVTNRVLELIGVDGKVRTALVKAFTRWNISHDTFIDVSGQHVLDNQVNVPVDPLEAARTAGLFDEVTKVLDRM